MDIYVFNKQFEQLGIIDTFKSLRWRAEYYKSGEFELHINLPEDEQDALNLVELFQDERLIIKEDSPEQAGIINSIALSEEINELLIVKGSLINNMLNDRLVWGEQSFTGTAEEVMKSYVSNNCIVPKNPNRVIPYLSLSPNRFIDIPANEQHSFKYVGDLMEELSIKHDIGWRILIDILNKQYIFDVFNGKDLSINQSINPHVVFALEYENIQNQKYTKNDAQYKNMGLIAGIGEGNSRKLITLNDELSGFDRKELFVDAKDLTNKTEDNKTIPEGEYVNLLIERGNGGLAEAQKIQTFQSDISILSNLIYKKDFNLGDIVTAANSRWGIVLNTRITVVEEVYENNMYDVKVNFGSDIPTLLDKIKQQSR